MPITQHPESDWLASYAAGTLPLSQAICVSAHLEHCSQCRQNYQRLTQLGGELINTLEPTNSGGVSFDNLMLKINSDRTESASDGASVKQLADSVNTDAAALNQAALSTETSQGIPKCLKKFIPEGYERLNWTRLSPSIQTSELCRDSDGTKVELLKIKPGGSAPTHTHLGDELTVILEGSFSDERGVYKAGDFMACDGSHQHTPVASQDRECICLVVSKAPIQFTGWFSRLFNPVLRRGYA
jgi:putative transcriptional regulator